MNKKAKKYRWNYKKCADNMMALVTLCGCAAFLVWFVCEWIMSV